MVEFRQLTINFDPTRGRRQRESATAVFSRNVRSAEAVLKGFNLSYTDNNRKVWQQEVDLDVTRVNGNTVTVAADFLIRDSSGRIDDRYNGFVQCVVIANIPD